ncbi:MAG: site-specific integrase [Acetobacteraceae bacterium]|nr:site-specific integrase [Acetobacteraceae bacterium]
MMKVLREGPTRITKATIDTAWRRRSADQRIVIGDSECRGLALVVNATGLTWRFDYKPRGIDAGTGKRFASRSITIGNPADHSPDDARQAANAHKGLAKAGGDPAAVRKARIASDAARRSRTVDRLVHAYIKDVPKRPRLRGSGIISPGHASEEISHVKAAVLAMGCGAKPIADIGAPDLRKLLRADPHHPNAARHRFGAISRFFDWCRDDGLVQANPCSMVAKSRRPKAPASRAEYLETDELARLWKLAETAMGLDDVHRDLIRFLIVVPCRRSEATHLEWPHVDLEDGIWAQPGHMTKNRDPHRLHLHPLALDILRGRHETAGKPKKGLVFPSPRAGKAIDTFTKIKAALAKADPGLTGWRFHDARRSFASTLGEAGIPEAVADAVLNHRQAATRGGVLGVYQRSSRWPEQVKAMELWGRLLVAEIGGKEASGAEIVVFAQNRA